MRKYLQGWIAVSISSCNAMALNKKKGSFTADSLGGETLASGGKTAGGGSNSVRVILLDGTALTVAHVDKKTLGQVAFDQVVRKLDLLERDYFGLLYEDDHKTMWLDLLKPIKKQLKKQPYAMFFRVRFYAVDPLALHRNSKEQFYLQLKDDISAGRLPFPSESAHSILSYVLQADVGDYQSSDEDLKYLQKRRLLTLGKDITAESSIIKLHKLLQGKSPDVAVEKFLRKTKELDSYGAKFNIVQLEGIPYRMSMSPAGITLYQDSSRRGHFKWRKVLQVSYKNKRLTLKIKSRSNESGEKTIVYEVESGKVCKDMWEQCVERVSFYNDHQASYKESAYAEGGKSRSPSPPITREYATINDATPQLEGARQASLHSSPAHSLEQDNPNPPPDREQQQREGEAGRGGEGGRSRHIKVKTGENHVEENIPEDEGTRGPLVFDSHGRVRRRKREEKRHPSTQQQPQSPQGPGSREGSEERENNETRDEDAMKRRSKQHSGSKALSLPRRLPTGDPMLHHMMQFQHLELHSSRGTLLSDSDSAVETTSPIVSTCDETSTMCMSPESGHRHGSREPEPALEVRHTRSQSLPQPQTEQWRPTVQPPYAGRDERREHARSIHESPQVERVRNDARQGGPESDRNGQEENSISEDRSEASIQSSLQELADLLGEDEAPREREGREQRSSVQSTPTNEAKRGEESPQQSRKKQAGVEVVTESSPQLTREKKRRQKQILLQRQQLKEQRLKEFIEKQKKEREENSKATDDSQGVSETHERPSRKHRNDQQNSPKARAGDIQTRGRGQYSLKARPHQSRQGPSHSPSRHNSDAGSRNSLKEQKMEERDMVRSWVKAQHKTQEESHLPSSARGSSSVPHASAHKTQHAHSTPTGDPIYNTLAPKDTSEGESDTAAEGSVGRSFELLPSSPPPPPYKSPSPPHETAVAGFGQMPHHTAESSTGWQRESVTQNTRTQSANRQHLFSSQAPPPTLRTSGEQSGGSHSTLSNASPQLSGSANRSPHFTHSFSGGSPSGSTATGSSPRTPIRAHSLKGGQQSPAKQPLLSLVPRRKEEFGRDGNGATARKTQPVRQNKGPLDHTTRGSGDELGAIPIDIDPSVLQKEDLSIAPHNYLKAPSPPYDKLDEEGEQEIPLVPLSKPPPAQSGTQYKLETALQEVMTSENLPPPPTHLLEISGQLEDIDYHDLDAPPSAASGAAIPSRADYEQQQQTQQQQKKGINPEMIAKSLDVPRRVSNPKQYPPHIAKFMSRVRNSSTDADDPTQSLRAQTGEQFFPDSTFPAAGEASNSDDIFTEKAVPHETEQPTGKSESRGNQKYDVPKSVLGRTLSLENASKQSSHPFANIGTRPRSGTAYTTRGQAPATSYSLPRGRYTPLNLQQFATGLGSREMSPPSAHTHTHSDHTAERAGRPIPGAQQSSDYLQNGVHRRNMYPSRPYGSRREAGDDSIPSSPTYFTHNHPHKDEPTPSPESKFLNQSFKEHLSSLQPSKGTNVDSWMNESWSSQKSVPLYKDPRRTLPSKAPNRYPHFYDQTHVSPPPTITPMIPSMGPKQPVRALHPPFIQQRELVSASNPAMNVPRSCVDLLASASSASSASNSSLPRNPRPRAAQTMPNYPGRPNSAKAATFGDNYYVLDV